MFVKTSKGAVEKEYTILKDPELLEKFPATITPAGLSPERELYLYEKIREFCPEEVSILFIIAYLFNLSVIPCLASTIADTLKITECHLPYRHRMQFVQGLQINCQTHRTLLKRVLHLCLNREDSDAFMHY